MASITQTFASLAISPKVAAAKATSAKVHFAGKAVKPTSARLNLARGGRGQALVVRADGEEAAAPAADAAAPAAAESEGDAAPARARGEYTQT